MEVRAPLLLSLCLIAGMLAVSLWAWPQIPDAAHIATHFDHSGHPNGYMSKPAALLFAPAMALAITLLMTALPRITRRKEGQAQSATAYIAGWLGMLVMLFAGHCGIILLARGMKFDMAGTGVLMPSLLFIVLGNFLGKTRPNSFVGVRTPWTRKSDLAWDKTNRLAGRLLVACGLASLATLAVSSPALAHRVLFTSALAMAALCILLSRYYWQKDPNRRL